MRSEAKSVSEYIDSLDESRASTIKAVRKTILDNLPKGYEEVMNWGMITYEVPLDIYPDTYNGKPLMYAALANQKNHCSLYLTAIYMDEDRRLEFENGFIKAGKKLNAGKSCVRFKKIEDLPLELIGETISLLTPEEFIERVEKGRRSNKIC